MTADRIRPGILTSRSELVVSVPSQRPDVLRVLQNLLAGFAESHPLMLKGNAAEADFDDTTIVLDLEIAGTSFAQADKVSQNLIRDLGKLINTQPATGQRTASPAVEQVSQTLVPA